MRVCEYFIRAKNIYVYILYVLVKKKEKKVYHGKNIEMDSKLQLNTHRNNALDTLFFS